MGWERADRIKNVFVKGQRFDLPSLLGSDTLAERYAAGAVVLSRLCPTDYHRFHFPCPGCPAPGRSWEARWQACLHIACAASGMAMD